MKNIVLDTWPLIAFFEEQSSAKEVEKILHASHQNGQNLILSSVNAGEVWYTVAHAHSAEDADMIIEEIHQLRIRIEPVSWDLTKTAARFKVGGGISYADCFAAALAKRRNAPLVTGDREFQQLENEIEIIWV